MMWTSLSQTDRLGKIHKLSQAGAIVPACALQKHILVLKSVCNYTFKD